MKAAVIFWMCYLSDINSSIHKDSWVFLLPPYGSNQSWKNAAPNHISDHRCFLSLCKSQCSYPQAQNNSSRYVSHRAKVEGGLPIADYWVCYWQVSGFSRHTCTMMPASPCAVVRPGAENRGVCPKSNRLQVTVLTLRWNPPSKPELPFPQAGGKYPECWKSWAGP
jgi:hypothetical protein